MKKSRQLIITVMVSLGFLGAATAPTQAATWHKGTPTTLRGHWKNKTINIGQYFGMKKFYSYESVRVRKNSVDAYLTQSAGWHITDTKWKAFGKNADTIVGRNELNKLHQARFTFKQVGHGYVHVYYDGTNIADETPFSPNFYRVSKKA